MASQSPFLSLYKERLTHDKEYRQTERRSLLLREQKKNRTEEHDNHRHIQTFKKHFKPESTNKISKSLYRNHIQLSEWLIERPDDLENWYLRPCPKGMRCLVVASEGKTQVFNKYGRFMNNFRSILPGDRKTRQLITILDCIYVSKSSEYFVLDALAYGNQDLTNCDAEFRFYWISSRIEEDRLNEISDQNQHAFQLIANCDCGDVIAMNSFLTRYPLWKDNCPELDGFLFYHKESSYVYGKTPLVLWLFAFMIPEVFNVPDLNENYLNQKPDNYTNYLDFINEFNDLAKSRRSRKSMDKDTEKMDEELFDECINRTIEDETKELELSGNDHDIGYMAIENESIAT